MEIILPASTTDVPRCFIFLTVCIYTLYNQVKVQVSRADKSIYSNLLPLPEITVYYYVHITHSKTLPSSIDYSALVLFMLPGSSLMKAKNCTRNLKSVTKVFKTWLHEVLRSLVWPQSWLLWAQGSVTDLSRPLPTWIVLWWLRFLSNEVFEVTHTYKFKSIDTENYKLFVLFCLFSE